MADKSYVPQVGQIGSLLDTTFFLFDDCIRNLDPVPVQEYERMVDTDETVAVGLHFLVLSILMKLGNYTHRDTKIAAFVNEVFENMSGNLYTACEDILTALWAGYSATEIVWKPENSRVVIDKLVTYHPRTVLIRVDRETGQYVGIKQWRWFAGAPVDIPRVKVILYTYGKRFGYFYGRSILKPIRKNWLLKDPILKMWARALDRFGTPIIGATVPDEVIEDPENPGRQITQIQWVLRLIANLQNGTGIAINGGPDGKQAKIEALTKGESGIGEAFSHAVGYLNKMILRGMLVPSLIFDEGQRSGSYALGQSHFAIYNMMISGVYRSLCEALIEQLVKPLVDYNFGKQQDYGTFNENKIVEDDKKLLYEGFCELTNAGYLDPTVQQDFDAVRSVLGLPERPVIPPVQKMQQTAQREFVNYTRGGDIGDPLGEDNAASG